MCDFLFHMIRPALDAVAFRHGKIFTSNHYVNQLILVQTIKTA